METTSKGPGERSRNLKGVYSKLRIGIVVSEWNHEITDSLYSAAFDALFSKGVKKDNVIRKDVPGSFELSLGAQWMAQEAYDAVICLGCVIQGETRHFEYICQSVAQGLKDVALKYDKPVIFGVLTTNTYRQAVDRAGGKMGNKGEEAALTALRMLDFQNPKK